MRRLVKGIVLPLTVSLSLLGVLAVHVQAGGGVGVGPSHIEVQDALRGGEYERSMMVFNSGDEDTVYSLSAQGEAASWVSFFFEDTAATEMSVPANGREEFTLKISVPEDAPNGEFTADIIVSSVPGALVESGSGQTVSLSTQSLLTIQVTGTQTIAAKVNGISAGDVEVGYPLVIKVYLENTGNVSVTPMIDASITLNEGAVDTFSYNETTVAAGQAQFINVEWDTTGNAPSEYGAHVVVSLEGETIAEADLVFNILPLGVLTRSGELKEIVIQGEPTVGVISRIVATFANTGEVNTWAEFSGEVYLDGSLIQTIESDKLMVERGTEKDLIAYFTPEQEGTYNIMGQVTYEGKTTEVKDVSFTATAAIVGTVAGISESDTEVTSQPFNIWIPIGAVIAALALAVIIILTVPWAKLKPARKSLIAQWARLKLAGEILVVQRVKLAGEILVVQRVRLKLARRILIAYWARLKLVSKSLIARWRKLLVAGKLSIWGWLHK